MARRTFDPKVVTSTADDGVVTDLPSPPPPQSFFTGYIESPVVASAGDKCGRNSCITPLEDRDGILFCVNCGPLV